MHNAIFSVCVYVLLTCAAGCGPLSSDAEHDRESPIAFNINERGDVFTVAERNAQDVTITSWKLAAGKYVAARVFDCRTTQGKHTFPGHGLYAVGELLWFGDLTSTDREFQTRALLPDTGEFRPIEQMPEGVRRLHFSKDRRLVLIELYRFSTTGQQVELRRIRDEFSLSEAIWTETGTASCWASDGATALVYDPERGVMSRGIEDAMSQMCHEALFVKSESPGSAGDTMRATRRDRYGREFVAVSDNHANEKYILRREGNVLKLKHRLSRNRNDIVELHDGSQGFFLFSSNREVAVVDAETGIIRRTTTNWDGGYVKGARFVDDDASRIVVTLSDRKEPMILDRP